MRRKTDVLFALLLVANDLALVALGFYMAYWLRQWIAVPPAVNIAPFGDYVGMMFIQMATMILLYFFSRLYDVKRSMPRLDEFYRILAPGGIVAFQQARPLHNVRN